jgi:hypothetical protein
MKTITIYEATDGARFDENIARKHRALETLARTLDAEAAAAKEQSRGGSEERNAYFRGEADARRFDADRLWTLVGGRPTP